MHSRIWEVLDVPSPRNVPAATIAKPIHNPYTTPQRRAIISWPNKGGNEMRMRIATGMRNPAGKSRIFVDTGFNDCEYGQHILLPPSAFFSGFQQLTLTI